MSSPNNRPCFIPADLDFDTLPHDVQVAVQEIVTPAYDELVLQAPNALERSTAFEYVHLLYLSILDQHEMAKRASGQVGEAAVRPPGDAQLERYLRLLSGKGKAGKFLLQARRMREQWEKEQARLGPWNSPKTPK